MVEILKEATKAITAHPYNFLYAPEVQRAFRALEQGIKERTEDTDTLVISIPAEKAGNADRLKQLPLPVTDGKDSNGIRTISFDWFSLPEDRTGFADVAGGFVSALVKGMNELPSSKALAENEIDEIKQKYTPGLRLRVVTMADDHGLPEGTVATVDLVDDIGQIHVKESGLALIPGTDEFEVVE